MRTIIDWYVGIKESYPHLKKYAGEKAAEIVVAMRPFTLLLPLVGGLFIFLTQMAWDNQLSLFADRLSTITLAIASLMLINGGGNAWTSVFDRVEDAINKPYRPIPQGTLTAKGLSLAGLLLFLAAGVTAWFVSSIFYFIVLVLMVLTLFYSAPPIRIKRFPWINITYQAGIRSFGAIIAVWSVFGNLNSFAPWGMATVIFFYIFSMQSTKDLTDVEGDRAAGIRTLPLIYGQNEAVHIMSLLTILPFGALLLQVTLGILPLSALLVLLAAVPVAYQIKILNSRPKWSLKELENSIVWNLFYMTALVFYMMFFIAFALQ